MTWNGCFIESRVATHLESLENLEKSGNSKVVREKSEKLKFASSVLPLWCNVPFV